MHSRIGFVRTLMLLSLSVAVAGAECPDLEHLLGDVGESVGPAGGTVESQDGTARVEIPQGSLEETTPITVVPVGEGALPAGVVPGTAFDFGPDGTMFDPPAKITITYDESQLPNGVDEADLRLHRLEGAAWVEVPGSMVDPAGNTIMGEVDHFTTFGAVPLAMNGALTRIVFVSRGDAFEEDAIFAINSDGTGLTRLTSENVEDDAPVISPDGSTIAFTREVERGGGDTRTTEQIFVMNSDGSNARQLTMGGPTNVGHSEPDFSQNGTQIVHSRSLFVPGQGRNPELFVMNTNGGNVLRLTDTSPENESNPSFGPGGSIVFDMIDVDGDNTRNEIFVLRGDVVDQVTDSPPFKFAPDFSPDGRQIVYMSGDPIGGFVTSLINAGGTNERTIPGTEDTCFRPRFSPDGTRIVVPLRRNSRCNLFVMNLDGSNKIQLTNLQLGATRPHWGPAPP